MSASPPLRILLVDDDPVFRELIAYVLRADLGVEIVGQAADGVRGLDLAVELRPDVVVMDLRMPVMNGFEATRRIVRDVPGVRVLVVSSSSEPEDVERAKRAGAAGFVPKDRAVTELSGEVGQLLPARTRPSKSALGQLFARRLVLG